MTERIKMIRGDCLEVMPTLTDGSIDIICIDPPYLYLKGQKLERPFDEHIFFSECKRLLTRDGFIIMFGRGESFYRWNTFLSELNFVFKEEVVWDKSYCSSPLMAMSRVHETISIWSKGKGVIKRCKVPYLEMKGEDINGICQDIKRIRTILKNPKSLEAVEEFLVLNAKSEIPVRNDYDTENKSNKNLRGDCNVGDRAVNVAQSLHFGLNEKSIIRVYDSERKDKISGTARVGLLNENRCVAVVRAIEEGQNEKTIIKQVRDHYSAIHPTQKPVRLIERLLALVLPDKPRNEVTVADFFGGSFSTMEACYNMGLSGIVCEIDEEYFNLGKQRIDALLSTPRQQQLF